MTKFTNKIDRNKLTKAVMAWALKTDGYEGAIGGVLDVIPYNEDMMKVWKFDTDEVHQKIDDAIGDTYAFCVDSLSRDYYSFKGEMSLFHNWVINKVDEIYKAYDEIIDFLNKKKEEKESIKRLPIGTKIVCIKGDAAGSVLEVTSNNYYIGFHAKHLVDSPNGYKSGTVVCFPDGISEEFFYIIR